MLMKKITFLFAFLLSLFGGTQAWADALTEGFESLTVDGTTLSNGWFVQGGTLKSTVTSITSSSSWDNAADSDYAMISKGANGTNTSICSHMSSNTNKYLIIPVEVTGKIKYYAGGTRTSGTRYVKVYRVTYDSGNKTYSIGAQIGSTAWPNARGSSSTAPNWLANKQEVELGDDHSMVAFLLQGSAIDEVEYEVYVSTPYVAPASISVVPSGNSAIITWTAGATEETVTAWNLEYKKSSDDVWSEVHGIAAGTLSQEISGLNDNTNYDVRVKAIYGTEESAWKTTTFKTAKVATPATGFTDNFETDKGWELINGTCPNKWVIGTGTNNGGTKSLYISKDGTSYASSSYGSSSLVYASKLFHFEAGDYTVSYDWKCNGESTYDFLRVALVPSNVELTASTSYSSLGSGSTLPTGWDRWLDGGSYLGGSTNWTTKSVDITIAETGDYQVVFAWRNDYSGGNTPAAIDNFKILGAAPVLELGGDVTGTTLAFGSVAETTNKTITITNIGKVAMENITLTETADEDNVFAYAALPKTTLAVDESMDVQATFSGSSLKDYTGTFRVAADDCDPINVTVTATYSNSPATMAVTLNEEAVGASVAFGSVGKQAQKTFTVTNGGDQTLHITSIASNNTTDFTVAPATLEVAGHSSETFTVTFVYDAEALDAEKTATITVTASNEGIEAKQFTVTGTRIEQWSEDFSGGTLPNGWIADNNYWTFADGVVKGKYNTWNRNNYLFTPLLIVNDASESLTFNYATTAGSVSIPIYYSRDGGEYTAYPGTPTSLANGVSGTFTITGLEAGNYVFRFGNDDYNLDNFEGFKLNADAPALTVDPTTAADFGKVKAQPAAKTYTITNSGTGTLTGTITSSDTDKFTVSESSFSLGAGENMTFDVNLVFDANYGAKAATITVHPTNDGLDDVVINATATTADPNIWEEDFEGGVVPDGWTANGWSVTKSNYKNNGTFMFAAGSSNTKAAYSPRLYAEKDQVLSFYVGGADATDFQTVKWSHDRNAAEGDWTLIGEFTSEGTQEFTAPETGYYYLSFQGKYTSVDNILGFKLAPLAHDAAITDQSIPTTGNQYVDYTATVTVKEMAGKAESGVVAKLYVDGVEKASDTQDLTANGTATFTMTFTPDAAIDAKKAYIKVTYEDVELTTEEIDLTIAAATVIDENAANVFTSGTKASVSFNYTKAAGKWGTIVLPFLTTVANLQTAFGKEIKVYEYKSSTENSMTFGEATTLAAGYAYIIYSDDALDGARFFGVNFTATSANYDGSTLKFQATYEPIAEGGMEDKWGVTPDGYIMKGSASATLKAMRGYLTTSDPSAHISIFIEDTTTGITTVLSSKEFEMENVYNLHGQKVNKAHKGLYIVNGKKVVRK